MPAKRRLTRKGQGKVRPAGAENIELRAKCAARDSENVELRAKCAGKDSEIVSLWVQLNEEKEKWRLVEAELEERRQAVQGMETALASANQNYQSFLQLNEEVNQIAKFLRVEYAREIETGQHSGLSLSQAVIRYLSRERRIGRWRRRIAEWMRPLKPC